MMSIAFFFVLFSKYITKILIYMGKKTEQTINSGKVNFI